MFRMKNAWLLAVVLLVVGAGVAFVLSGFFSTHRQVNPFNVPESEIVHLTAAGTTSLDDPDPDKVYVVEAGAHVKVTRPLGDPLQGKQLRLLVDTGGTLEGAVGTNIFVVTVYGAVAHVGDGVFIEAFGGEVFASGDSRVKALDKSIIHNTGTGDEHAYAGSITYARMRGRVFANDGATVYVKSPKDCDACSQVSFVSGARIYIYNGAEAFGRGSPNDVGKTVITVFKGGEIGCYKYCTIVLAPGAEHKDGQGSVVRDLDPKTELLEFPDGEDDPVADQAAKDAHTVREGAVADAEGTADGDAKSDTTSKQGESTVAKSTNDGGGKKTGIGDD